MIYSANIKINDGFKAIFCLYFIKSLIMLILLQIVYIFVI